MNLRPVSCPALVLNANFQPLSYFPLSLWSWKNTIRAVFLDRVNVVSEYEVAVHSPNLEIKLPSVISLKESIDLDRKPAFTRFNVFLRDRFCCQYCGGKFRTEDLTFDHVLPRSHGGKTIWKNVVTACRDCNRIKGNKILKNQKLNLLSEPLTPNTHELQKNGRLFPPHYLHESWRDFLYWDSELQP